MGSSSILTRAHLVFIPAPGVGHMVPMVEFAKLLVKRDGRLSITMLLVNLPSQSKDNPLAELLASVTSQIRLLELPWEENPTGPSTKPNLLNLTELYKPRVRVAVADLARAPDSSFQLAGFVIDTFCSPMIDIANEFGVPSYIFFTGSAAVLGYTFHVQALQDEEGKDLSEFKGSDAELEVSTLVNPLPAKVFPTFVLDRDLRLPILGHVKRFRETKGIVVNSFEELEPHAVKALSEDGKIPPVYTVGPILNLKGGTMSGKSSEILSWLDDQPRSSVVFLCFGSQGSFHENQVMEMARGLEKSGCRFLWSLRRAMSGSNSEEVQNLEEVLPKGFLDRTSGRGKVIGWAPQAEVLAHPSVGGFVTHCGWNSTLESLWFGVPTAAWPLYAEQPFNAFTMVVEHGMAVEVKMDYRNDDPKEEAVEVVGADVVERAIRRLMQVDDGHERKEKVRQMSEMSRKTLVEGGSSHSAVRRFISEVFHNIPDSRGTIEEQE